MVSVKDYATTKNVSPQAIYGHLKRYAQDLDSHIIKEFGIKMLDNFAVEFLNSKIEGSPLVLVDSEKSSEIKRLENENHQLLIKLTQSQDVIISQSKQIIDLQNQILQLETTPKKKRWSFFNK